MCNVDLIEYFNSFFKINIFFQTMLFHLDKIFWIHKFVDIVYVLFYPPKPYKVLPCRFSAYTTSNAVTVFLLAWSQYVTASRTTFSFLFCFVLFFFVQIKHIVLQITFKIVTKIIKRNQCHVAMTGSNSNLRVVRCSFNL